MAGSFTFNLKGLEETLKKLGDEGKKIGFEIEDELGSAAENIALEAIQRISTNTNSKGKIAIETGHLKGNIRYKKTEGRKFNYTVGAYTTYAPYVEFGTGRYAASYVPSIDSEWQKIAKQYYKNGQGRMEERPFLYPSYRRQEPILINQIKNILGKDVRL